jgi:hypothetical protein
MKIALAFLCSTSLLGLAACGAGNAGSDGATPLGAAGAAGAMNGTGGSTGETGGTGGLAPLAVTLTTAPRQVAPGAEIYACQDFRNPFGKDVAITESESTMTKGSHHMFAFELPEADLSLFDTLTDCPQGGIEFHEYVHTSQTPEERVLYPAGVGRLFVSAAGFRIMIHLLNTSAEPMAANVTFGLGYVDPSAVPNKAASMFLNNLGLRVPAGKSTQTGAFVVPSDIMMLRAASHMHRHGSHFIASTASGTMLYESSVWDEPTPRIFDPPMPIHAGDKITWACDFENDTGATLGFGESAAKNEMCIFAASFYDGTGYQMNAQYPYF